MGHGGTGGGGGDVTVRWNSRRVPKTVRAAKGVLDEEARVQAAKAKEAAENNSRKERLEARAAARVAAS